MYSGNLGVVHEMDSVAQIIRQLQMMPNVCFLFVGDGSGKVRLEELVRREGLNNVRFVGYQEKEDLRYSLSAGDIHLVTLRSDMAGLSVPSKVYGIMAVGRPVIFIGPEESEVAILIRESLCGEVFDPVNHEKAGRAILDLAQDPRRREYLGAEGRRYFEMVLDKKFAIPRFQAALYDLLKER
ncbi:MAG: glycosyltransferase family 4 protein [Nitrospirae bacterium]|nr:MAG: glycosyltransferase family 4 protein [Nitrospirota bacterium]